MVGVVKQEKSNGKLQQIDTIQFGNTQLTLPEPDYDDYMEYDMAMVTTSHSGPNPPMPMPVFYEAEEAED